VDFNNDILITGSEDSSLAVWSMDTFDKMDVLNGHNGGITGVQVELLVYNPIRNEIKM
jgi:hypothetical protein